MLAVLIVHSAPYLDPVLGVNLGHMLSRLAIVCDPIFFALSGYFAIRPLNTSLGQYYAKKFKTIVLPLIVYALILYPYSSNYTDLSVRGFIHFFAAELSPWWFIPALIPFLMVAPFLYKFFEGLSGKEMKLFAALALTLSAWGVMSTGLAWLATDTGHPTIADAIAIIQRLVPAAILPNNYLIYFIAGYFLRRLAPIVNTKQRTLLICLGIISWILDAVYAYYGITLVDPSYHWLLATTSAFLLIDKLRVTSPTLQTSIAWTAARSYSIYLLNYVCIQAVFPFFKETLFGAALAEGLVAPLRILIWLCSLAACYLLALLAASIVDCTILKAMQNLVGRLTDRFWKHQHACNA